MITLKGALIIKPNTYTILLGESGLGKEFPISLSTELVQKVEVTRVIAGRSSIQAIVKELSQVKSRNGKPPIMDSRGYIVNGELSTAIIADADALTILTDLYDRKTTWTNLLKIEGAESIKNPYITTLFGASPAHFYDSIPQVNIEGGYIGRTFVVYEDKLAKQTDLLSSNLDEDASEFPYDKFTPHLEKISQNSGRIIYNEDVRDLYNNWRRQWRETKHNDKTGFAARVPVHVLKVAMCLCLSEEEGLQKLVITQPMIEEAIERVTNLVYKTRQAVEGTGKDPLSAQTKMVLDFLIQAEGNTLTRKQLLTKGYGNYKQHELDLILDNLLAINWIRREKISGTSSKSADWRVHLSGKPLEEYKAFLEKQNQIKLKKFAVERI
jgi:hypothetical protein